LTADAVVLAVPATPAGRLLRDVAPMAAADLARIEYASSALVTLAFAAGSLPDLPGSGFLVPAVEGRVVKAATFFSRKWGWLREAAPDLEFVRCSVGRRGDEADLRRDDDELVDVCATDLAAAVGGTGRLVDARVTRWGGGLPQYAVGHRARVERIEGELARFPTLDVCGAAYAGIGVPACIRTANAAADRVLAALGSPA
jgi:oxygen-dependent protoporphyrinogen oxidase